MPEMPTLADELLLEAQSPDVKKAISRFYPERETAEEIEIRATSDAFRTARKNIRAWFENREKPMEMYDNDIDELINYIDT